MTVALTKLLDRQIAQCERELAEHPDSVEARQKLTKALDQAIRQYEQEVQRRPGSAEVRGRLAAAYAAAGRFPEAVAAAQEAVALAAAGGHTVLAEQIQARLKLYEQKRAYREPGQGSASPGPRSP
jgi:hypothetical protein